MMTMENDFDSRIVPEEVGEEGACMTAGTRNNIYIVGSRKAPEKPVPAVSKARIEQAIKETSKYIKKKP